MVNNQVIFSIELNRVPSLSKELLDNLTTQNGVVFGVKREGYYVLNTNRVINNFQQTQEVEHFNMFLNACTMKGYSLLMIKI